MKKITKYLATWPDNEYTRINSCLFSLRKTTEQLLKKPSQLAWTCRA